jgi:ClpP class serine protease
MPNIGQAPVTPSAALLPYVGFRQIAAKGPCCSHLQLRKEVGRNRYFTPQQAIEYGLIDKIVGPQDGSQASAAQ